MNNQIQFLPEHIANALPEFRPGHIYELIGHSARRRSKVIFKVEDAPCEDVTPKKQPVSPFKEKIKKVYQGAIKGWKDKARK